MDAVEGEEETTMRIFQRDWQIYRKMVANNFLFHREAYGRVEATIIGDTGV